jgi:cell division protein FtsB
VFIVRLIVLAFAFLLILIQYPLWLGKGGWLRVWELERQLGQVHGKNEQLRERNAKLASEIDNLKNSTESVEERARLELGMLRKDEIFVQILDANASLPPPPAPKEPAPPAEKRKR